MCYIINFFSNGKIELKKKLLKHKVILVASIISFGVMLVSLYYYNTRIGLTLITYFQFRTKNYSTVCLVLVIQIIGIRRLGDFIFLE